MTTNPVFTFNSNSTEQDLYESMIIESIQIYGFDVYYLPRTLDAFDEVFRESEVNTFDTALTVEMYLKENLKFGGDGKFIGVELGFEIRDQTTFTVARSRFETEAEGYRTRPQEGDLVYFPFDKKLYEVRFVEHQEQFYQLGTLYTYDLQCELLEYTGQKFSTGIADIDVIETRFDLDGEANNEIEDWIDQSPEIQEESNTFIQFTEKDPFSQGGNL